MSKGRYKQYGYESFKDTETGDIRYDFIDVMNEQDQKIKELEHRLANSIEPKFKIGQEVFIIFETTEKKYIVERTNIDSITIFAGNELSYYCKYVDGERMYLELDKSELFATEEEAKAKLEEIQNANN